ncbi:MAG: chemotaxis protein CheD [Planctomycetota bacterium]|nr:MAG: chemotaxis protein CheD [Planctomycetota bacterium]
MTVSVQPGTSAGNKISVGMGQVAVGKAGDLLCSVLGSCVGVALWHPRLKVGALAHVVLADSQGKTGTPGKFADTAVAHMVGELEKQGAMRTSLVAKIAGGSCMFRSSGPLQIGDDNIKAVREHLKRHNIRIAAEDTGGNSGRRITLDCATGSVSVEVAGKVTKTL